MQTIRQQPCSACVGSLLFCCQTSDLLICAFLIPSKPRLPTFTDIPNVWPGAELGPITLPSSIFVDYICLDFIICVYRKSKFVHRMQIVSRTKSFPFSRRFVAEYERRCVRRDLCLSLTDELFTNFKSIAVSVFFFASLAAVKKGSR